MMNAYMLEQYKKMHAKGHFAGYSSLKWVDDIKPLCLRSKRILDYGSGKGLQYTKNGLDRQLGVDVACYDPAVEWYAEMPEGMFDGVICTDVMEHVPKEDVPRTIAEIYTKAQRWVFFAVSLRPAKKDLPDGQNAHVTLESAEWWDKQFERDRPSGVNVVVRYER